MAATERSVPGDVGQQQAADPACRATRGVVNVATALRLSMRFAVDPGVQPTEDNAPGRKLASAPYFHAFHMLRGRIAHGSIIRAFEPPAQSAERAVSFLAS